jgi:hypothetical protein
MEKETVMRKIIVLLLALALSACGTAPLTVTEAPTVEPVLPTQTPVVVVETVVVTVIPTNVPTEIPSATPVPPPTEVPATQPPAPTAEAAAAPATEPSNGGLVTIDNALGAGWFTNMTLTGNTLALRCQLYKQVTFSVRPADPGITQVDLYYRIEDRATGAIFDWQGPRRMLGDGQGNFAVVFSGEDVNANFRKPNAWFDFQFVGLSRSGGRVGNSEKIIQKVNYTFDCP